MQEQAKDGHPVSAATRRKISKTMKGKPSNFKGKQHTDAAKDEQKRERGHDDRVKGRRWRTDKRTGEESRVYKKGSTKRYRWGRAIGEWVEASIDEDHGGSNKYFYISFRKGDDWAIVELYYTEGEGWSEEHVGGTFTPDDIGGLRFGPDVEVDAIMYWESKDHPDCVIEGPYRSMERAEDYLGVTVTESVTVAMLDENDEYFVGTATKSPSGWTTAVNFGIEPIGFSSIKIPASFDRRSVFERLQREYSGFSIARFNFISEAQTAIAAHYSTSYLTEFHDTSPFFYVLIVGKTNFLLAEMYYKAPFWRTTRITGSVPQMWYTIVDDRDLSEEDLKARITSLYSSGNEVRFFDDHRDAFSVLKSIYTKESASHIPNQISGFWHSAYSHALTKSNHASAVKEASALYASAMHKLASSYFTFKEDACTYLDSMHGIQLFEAMQKSNFTSISWLAEDTSMFKVKNHINEALASAFINDPSSLTLEEMAKHRTVPTSLAKPSNSTISIPVARPRNPLVTTSQRSGAGQHRDKKREQRNRHLDELSNERLARYKKKAGEDASAADKAGDFERGNKRFRGIVNATKKQFKNDANARYRKQQ